LYVFCAVRGVGVPHGAREHWVLLGRAAVADAIAQGSTFVHDADERPVNDGNKTVHQGG